MTTVVPRAGSVPASRLSVERVQPSYVQVANRIRALVLSRQLAAGERLPPEGELASLFGVSRSTVREALRLLAAEHLIETRRGARGGVFVVHPDPAAVELALSTAITLAAGTERLSMGEVFEVWQITQVPAAALAARRRTDGQAERLLELSGPPPSGLSHAQLVLRGIEFHDLVLEAAGNRLLQICTRPLNGIGASTVEESAKARRFLLEAADRHRSIAEAITARDEQRAGLEMGLDMSHPPKYHELRADLAPMPPGYTAIPCN